ncbi:MAG: tRNA pseudouridine synthase [Pseudomonadota bacterium]
MRIALGITYNGQPYQGWQSQSTGLTIQDKLEKALKEFTTQKVTTLCAGRTDAGVHGLMQVVHFDTPLERDMGSWVRGTNRYLPDDISVQWAHEVPAEFHARGSALSRRYAYIMLESPVRPSLEFGRAGWVYRPLDETSMRQASQYLLGEHDFTSFRASSCQALSPVKNMMRVDIHKHGPYWRFEFEGNAFLHHMIRNIMGCMVTIGQGFQTPEWMAEVIESKRRDAAAPTFSPDGLYFQGPVYEPKWGLPSTTPPFHWLP